MDWKFVRSVLCFFLAWLMVNPSGPPSGFAKDDAATNARRASDVKAAVLKLGTGKNARVMVSLEDNQKLTGYVDAAQEDGLLVGNVCTDQAARVPYDQVTGLRGLNVATGTKVAVGPKPKGTPKLSAGPDCGRTFTEVNPRRPNTLVRDILLGCLAALVITAAILASK